MMYGAKSLNCLVNPITTRYAPQAKEHARRVIAANWQALTFSPAQSVGIHSPAPLLATLSSRPVTLSPSELEVQEWLESRAILRSIKVRRYGRAKNTAKEAGHGHRLPTKSIPASQLWPSEVRAAAGFQVINPSQGSNKIRDALTMTLAELVATQAATR